jgi:hypothetical protein
MNLTDDSATASMAGSHIKTESWPVMHLDTQFSGPLYGKSALNPDDSAAILADMPHTPVLMPSNPADTIVPGTSVSGYATITCIFPYA